MRKLLTYGLLFFMLLLAGCRQKKEKLNWNVSLGKNDKNPYGAYIAYESLKYYFPGVKIDGLSQGFRYNNIDDEMKNEKGVIVMVLSGLEFQVSEEEMYRLIAFVEAGNEVLLFCSDLDNKLEERLGCYKATGLFQASYEEDEPNQYNTGSENAHSIYFATDTNTRYGYNGRTIRGWFTLANETDTAAADADSLEQIAHHLLDSLALDTNELSANTVADSLQEGIAATSEEEGDTTVVEEYYDEEEDRTGYISENPDVLGYADGHPNFIRYEVGRGHITLHAAPLSISNYFLLQNNNLAYLDGIWNSLPEDVTHIYWNSYYKHRADHSDLSILWKNPATRWALWLSIITLVLYVLLELKRRQAPIPIVKPLENTSASFVETVGRLYYNKGDHKNLAEKMVQHFLEWVRNHHYLSTNQLNEAFARQLAARSGLPVEVVNNMIEMIHEIRQGNIAIDEAYLYHLNNTIQRFHKKP